MTRNCRKMIEKMADSLLLSKHSVQFLALFLLLSAFKFKISKISNLIPNLIENTFER